MNGVDELRCALVGGSRRTPVRTSRRRQLPSAFGLFLPLLICGVVQAGDPPPVVVDSIEPAELVQGQVPSQPEIQVFGSNFIEGLPSKTNRPTVTLRHVDDLAEFSVLAFVDFAGTVATVPPLTWNFLQAPLGAYDVIVTRPTDDASATLKGAFTLVTDDEPGPGEIALVVRSAWGGPVNDVDVVGNLAYAAIGRRLVILNVEDATNPIEIGSIGLAGVTSVTVRDSYAFVAAGTPYRFTVVDVSDPTNPFLVSAGLGDSHSHDVQLYGNLVYVRASTGSVRAFDITNPGSVTPLGVVDPIGGNVAAISIVGDLLYVGTSPICCLAELKIYDLASDPLNPVLLGSIDNVGEKTTGLAVEGDYLVWTVRHDDEPATTSLQVVDVSDPQLPIIVGSYNNGPISDGHTLEDVALSGGHAYVADAAASSFDDTPFNWAFAEGLIVFDIATDPTNPTIVSSFKTHGDVTGVEIVGDRAHLHDSGEGLIILDISDPANPVRLGNHYSPAALRQMVKEGDLLYISDAWNGFTILDVSDAVHPEVVGVYFADHYNNLGVNAFGLVLRDKLVYLGAGYLGLEVVDVSDPSNPALLGAFRVPLSEDPLSRFSGVALSGDVAHVGFRQHPACSGFGMGWFLTFDVSVPQSIVELGQVQVGCGPAPRTIELNDRSMAFVARDGGNGSDNLNDLTIDTFDPENPTVTYNGVVPAVADVELDGNVLYLASGERGVDTEQGLYIQDVTDPTNPVLLAHMDEDNPIHDGDGNAFFPSLTGAVTIQNQRAYVAGSLNWPGSFGAFYVLDVTDPATPILLDFVPRAEAGGPKSDVHVDEPYVFVTNGNNLASTGLAILELVGLSNPADLDGDGSVGVKDLLILLGDWGPCDDCTDCPADLDGDCTVGVKDLLILLGNWG